MKRKLQRTGPEGPKNECRGTDLRLISLIATNITAGDAPLRVPSLRGSRRDVAAEWITAVQEICLRGYIGSGRVSRGRARTWRDGPGLCRDASG